ncbi:VanZ family protein [Methanococcoides alaskense]|uniref:VanZ family protein n=1 Tax=Methanococcoides alaskense TaxID=325778 RepID=A0AA90TYQ8_9EURY|nr:VanZ family protein [Methanococcoides alaskense]MDR6222633.1 VanZ family protein [Methanococcoides alaskense]
MTDKQKLIFRIFVVFSLVYAAIIFYLSAQSSIDLPSSSQIPFYNQILDFVKQNNIPYLVDIAHYSIDNFDKVAHMILYFGFGILLHFTFRHSDNLTLRKYSPVFAIFIGVAYGISDEIHQMYVPGRTSSFDDLVADSIGITLAQIVFWLVVLKSLFFRKYKKEME